MHPSPCGSRRLAPCPRGAEPGASDPVRSRVPAPAQGAPAPACTTSVTSAVRMASEGAPCPGHSWRGGRMGSTTSECQAGAPASRRAPWATLRQGDVCRRSRAPSPACLFPTRLPACSGCGAGWLGGTLAQSCSQRGGRRQARAPRSARAACTPRAPCAAARSPSARPPPGTASTTAHPAEVHGVSCTRLAEGRCAGCAVTSCHALGAAAWCSVRHGTSCVAGQFMRCASGAVAVTTNFQDIASVAAAGCAGWGKSGVLAALCCARLPSAGCRCGAPRRTTQMLRASRPCASSGCMQAHLTP